MMATTVEAPPRHPAASEFGPGTVWQRLTRGVQHFHANAEWIDCAGPAWQGRILEIPVTDDFHQKQGRSTGRLILESGGRRLSVYLKRHYRLSWWQGMLATLLPGGAWSPGMRERRNLHAAAQLGLPVPKVVAAGEWIGPRFRLQSFLAIEELAGMLPLHQAIPSAHRQLDPKGFCRWKMALTREMARLARLMHDRCWFHKDLYLCHFYLPEEDIRQLTPHASMFGRLHVIDLHRLKRHPVTSFHWILKDLGGLLFSSDVIGVTARDRLRFWRFYCGSKGRSWREHLAAWCIRVRGWNYRRHNAKRKNDEGEPQP
jgi:lipopolysaccharide kinase (Kdo/WaaP) family protein